MQLCSYSLAERFARRSLPWIASVLATVATSVVAAKPHVEFDFARAAECRDITTSQRAAKYPHQRLVEMMLPVSVRFRGIAQQDVDELDIEISGAMAGLRVHDFAPDTQLASDIEATIETTTTIKRARSLDGTLGGALPVPYAEIVAHVSPSINAGISRGETATEKLNRLPPMHVVVVSGTSSEGRGVFFKLKRSSQTSLEGIHEFIVQFVAPANWRGGKVLVGCTARGTRKMLWLDQPATLGGAKSDVVLHVAGRGLPRAPVRHVVAKQPVLMTARGPTTEQEHLSGAKDSTAAALSSALNDAVQDEADAEGSERGS